MNSLEWAAYYASKGLAVFPIWPIGEDGKCTCGRECGSPGKHPVTISGLKEASSDIDQLIEWFEGRELNIAIATGEVSGVMVVDVDVAKGKPGVESIGALAEKHGGDWLATAEVTTGSGGTHLFYRYVEGVKNSVNRDTGIDVRADGGYVVAPPSNHLSGGTYEWARGLEELGEIPREVLEAIQGKKKKGKKSSGGGAGHEGAPPGAPGIREGGRNAALASMAGSMRRRDMTGEAILAALLEENRRRCVPPLPESEVEAIAKSIGRYEPSAPAHDWKAGLAITASGAPKKTTNNTMLVLENDDAWRGAFAYNARSDRVVVARDLPTGLAAGGSVADADCVEIAAWIERHYGFDPSASLVWSVVGAVAAKHSFDPVHDYMEGLRWDGVERIDTWLIDYCGAEDTPFTRAAGARWLISAVARTFEPGCQADHVLVLEGAQGIGKSSTFRLLGEPWYASELQGLGTKTAIEQLQGVLIVELAELAAMYRSDLESVKAFITRVEDRFRPAYGRATVYAARRCVFGATTNDSAFLMDSTGNRRFWCVSIGSVDLPRLKADRGQLWAEAVARYKAGTLWHLNEPELWAEAEEVAEDHMVDDPWEDMLSAWLSDRKVCTMRQILDMVLQVERRDYQKHSKKVGAILRRLGWHNIRVRTHNGRLRIYTNQNNVSEELIAQVMPKVGQLGQLGQHRI